MSALYCCEIDINNFKTVQAQVYCNGDFSEPILYENKPLTIQIDNVKLLFGLLTYKNPTGNQKHVRFSTALCANTDNLTGDMDDNMAGFIQLNKEIEDVLKESMDEKDKEFVDTIKVNKKGEKHIRVKVPNRYGAPDFDVFVNDNQESVTMKELANMMTHGRMVRVILGLGNVWHSGGKTGISWKLKAIGFTKVKFRSRKPKKKNNKNNKLKVIKT